MMKREPFQFLTTAIRDTHVQSSLRMITEAADLAGPGAAAVLGCGKGSEMPMRHLARKFEALDCVDLDGGALKLLESQCQQWADVRHRCRFYCADLTGLIPQIMPEAQAVVAASADPVTCLDQLGELLGSAKPDFWKGSPAEHYSLVICSAVLTQLQATVRSRVEHVFLERFPGHASMLSSHQPWKASIWKFARALEDAFILNMATWCAPTGIVYLSDTVHVCWLKQSGPESFTTEGAWIATRTSRLADYLDPWHEILAEQQWDWIKMESEEPYAGRLYGVQALIYRAGSPGHDSLYV
jgi:hypothetical protein